MSNTTQIRFAELLTLHVNNVIKKQFINELLTPQTLQNIRCVVHKTINDIFVRSSHKLSPEAISWIANRYFKSIKMNGVVDVNNLIVMHEHRLSDLVFSDIQLMQNLFNETMLASDIENEYHRRRTAS